MTFAYCEARSFSSGVKEAKLLYVLKCNCGVLLCSSYANLACVMTVNCLLLDMVDASVRVVIFPKYCF